MDKRAAAALAFRAHDLDPVAGEQAARGDIDRGLEDRLRATLEHRDAPATGSVDVGRGLEGGQRGKLRGREFQHRAQAVADAGQGAEEPTQGAGQKRPGERQTEALRIGQDTGQDHAQQPVREPASVGCLDMGARMIHEMHVVHAGGAGRHAGKARQAAIHMLDHLRRGRPVVLQHVLDEIDATARGIQFVAFEQVGRAGRGAEAAMHAAPQDLF